MNETHPQATVQATDDACFEKAKAKGEPTFTLRSQDVTAALFVRLWADSQRWIAQNSARGIPVVESVTVLEQRFAHVCEDASFLTDVPSSKVVGAYQIAEKMEDFPGPKKVAD